MSNVVKTGLVIYLAAAPLVAAASCAPEPKLPPTHAPTSCADACGRARALCGPSALTPRGGTCEDVCRVTEESGGDFRTGCLSNAKTCEDVQTCSR